MRKDARLAVNIQQAPRLLRVCKKIFLLLNFDFLQGEETLVEKYNIISEGGGYPLWRGAKVEPAPATALLSPKAQPA